ncbi:hypothetical protein [Chiayiivirga flava]|uniref:Uncharacterized protein n=1 Tax=Chiayiivirga flava TaxID=659595 RepID=A0A7W8D854_9GAMM|nr:hypothetical protein [Chiayiivirga flava]
MRAAQLFRRALALLLLAGTADAAVPCEERVLAALGWRFVADDGAVARIEAGTPCDRATLDEAHALGDLRVRMPRGITYAARATLYAQLRDHPATHCAYGFALGAATRRAVDSLVANPRYAFFGLQTGWIGFGAGGARADGWERIRSFGRGYRPAGSNRRAIEAFYTGSVRSECGVGRQIAQYATLAELFGGDGFDRAFAADEIVIGTFNQLHGTRSILLGSEAGTFTRDGLAVQASRDGRQAFAGLPGFIEHVFDAQTLDDSTNRAENFVIYDVDAAAAEALRRHGGFAHYNRINRELWELSRQVNPHAWGRGFERLLIDRDAALRARQGPNARATLARMDALLDDPFYRGMRIYVHKLGVKPVGFHIARLLDRNPRTPYRIELVLHNLHTTLFDRYLDDRLRTCETDLGGQTPANASHQSVGL